MPMPPPGQGQDIAARILLVDRDEAGCSAMIETLGQGFWVAPDIVVARGGREAADRLRVNAFDLLLADLGSVTDLAVAPEDAVSRLVRLAPGSLIIALSDGGSVSTMLAALQAGAHEHVTRPVVGASLVERLSELAQRHGRPIAGAFRSAGDRERLAGLLDASNQLQTVLEFVAHDLPGSAEHLEGVARRIVAMFDGTDSGQAETEFASPAALRPMVLPMWQQEQRIIEEAIESFGGNIALAAQALELSPSTIYRKRQAWSELEGKRGAA